MKNYEKIILTILAISLLLNVRQCSDADDFEDEKLIFEYELIEVNGSLGDLKLEVEKLNKLLTKNPITTKPEVPKYTKSPRKQTTTKVVDSTATKASVVSVSDTTSSRP